MNPFTRHPQSQGVSYREHCHFAMSIAWRLLKSVIAFGVHAVLPFISIPRELDLEASAAFLLQRNRWIENAAANGSHVRNPARPRHGMNAGIVVLDSKPPLERPGDSADSRPVFALRFPRSKRVKLDCTEDAA